MKLRTNPGKDGQVLISQGADNPPIWADFQLETIDTGDYILTNLEMKDDRTGLVLGKNEDYSFTVNYGDALNSSWTVLEGISSNITIGKNENRVIYTFQTVLQSPYDATQFYLLVII